MNVDDYYNILDDAETKYGNWYEINKFLLNTILVLSGARPSYRIDISEDLRSYLIDAVLSYYDELSIIKYTEPLLFLTVNKEFIKIYETDTIGVGKVLGYCYNEFDWMNTGIDRLSITPTATDDYGKTVELYHTMIPKYAYAGKVLDCVLDQIKLFDEVLEPYGFNVTLSIKVRPGKQDAYSYSYEQLLQQYKSKK